jgi:NAD(P)-dependent dehydrogenase (short-subunit alcohol dehydrogenase family)
MIALVTGANRGIGREVCRQLAEQGHTVVATARRPHAPGVLRLDVTSEDDIQAVSGEIARRHGRLDVLINNAAITYDTWQRPSTADLGVVREALETNLYAAWRLVQVLLPLLRKSDHPRIVNVSSEAGSFRAIGASTPAYTTSKVALNALTVMLAAELRGFLVNAVCPGWVATDMGGPGGRPVAEGAASVVWAATLADDGPTGGFFRDGRPLSW